MDSLRRERLSAGARIQFGFVGAARERPVFALAETHEGLETDRNLSGDREKESGSFLMEGPAVASCLDGSLATRLIHD